MSDNVYIIGAGMIKFGKYLNRDIKDLSEDSIFNRDIDRLR